MSKSGDIAFLSGKHEVFSVYLGWMRMQAADEKAANMQRVAAQLQLAIQSIRSAEDCGRSLAGYAVLSPSGVLDRASPLGRGFWNKQIAWIAEDSKMSMALNGELSCGESCPWLSTAMKCLTGETTPLARGAADAEHLLSSVSLLCHRHPLGPVCHRHPLGPVLLDRFVNFVNAVDDARVAVLDLLCFQVKACCNNQNSINEFMAKATDAYHHIDGGLIQSQPLAEHFSELKHRWLTLSRRGKTSVVKLLKRMMLHEQGSDDKTTARSGA